MKWLVIIALLLAGCEITDEMEANNRLRVAAEQHPTAQFHMAVGDGEERSWADKGYSTYARVGQHRVMWKHLATKIPEP